MYLSELTECSPSCPASKPSSRASPSISAPSSAPNQALSRLFLLRSQLWELLAHEPPEPPQIPPTPAPESQLPGALGCSGCEQQGSSSDEIKGWRTAPLPPPTPFSFLHCMGCVQGECQWRAFHVELSICARHGSWFLPSLFLTARMASLSLPDDLPTM